MWLGQSWACNIAACALKQLLEGFSSSCRECSWGRHPVCHHHKVGNCCCHGCCGCWFTAGGGCQVDEGALTEELRNALLDIKPELGDFEPAVEPE